MKYPLTIPQLALLYKMKYKRSRPLCNSNEGKPRWYFDGGDSVDERAASGLLLRGLITPVDHVGGHPGVFTFKLTDAGRVAAYRPHFASREGAVKP